MESPFIDLPIHETIPLYSEQGEPELESPLLDPENLVAEAPAIDLHKAVTANQQYSRTIWNGQMQNILDYFFSKGFVSSRTQDQVHFAEGIAKWQATQFTNKRDIDGILGPTSWKLLKPLLSTPTVSIRTPSQWQSLIKGAVLSPAKPLVDGEETFRAMVEAIKSANGPGSYIYVMGWMLQVDFQLIPGNNSSSLKDLLMEAAQKRNVEVRALIWDNPVYIKENRDSEGVIDQLPNSVMVNDNFTYGSPGVQKAILEIKRLISLFKYGVAALIPGGGYSVDWLLSQIKPWTNFEDELRALRNEGSHHEKVMIVKNDKELIGFCGGIDINCNRIYDKADAKKSTILHDVHCEVRDHGAWELLQRFLDRWNNYKNGRLPYVNPYTLIPLRGQNEPEPKPVNPVPGTAYVKVFHTYNHPNDPAKKERSIRDNLKTAIMNARESVYLEDQYMISLEIATWLNLKLMKEPGFKSVGILTQDDDYAGGDLQFPQSMRKKFIELLTRGLDQATIDKKVFVEMLDPEGKPFNRHMVHSKIYIIDGQTDDPLAIIGSANCSSRSMTNDSETSAFIFNDKSSSGSFVSSLNFRMNYDDKISRLKYIPNPKFKDRDVQLHEDIENFLNKGSSVIKFFKGVAVGSLLRKLDSTLTDLKPLIIDVIDPDADNTVPQQELPDGGYNMPVHEITGRELSLSEYDIPGENENVMNRDESLVTGEEESEIGELEFETLKPCEGYVCWSKTVLNNLMGSSLAVDSRIDVATRQALESFQNANNISKTGKLDAATERALLEADTLKRYKSTARATEIAALLTAAKTKIEDWTKQAINNKPALILDSYRDPRKLWAFVLHHMAFKRRSRKTGQFSDPNSYLTTGAHFCIMFDGRIAQLYPLAKMIWHAQCTSPRSVSVEFEGNFPNIHGKWWIDKDGPNRDHPTNEQYEAGRFLVRYLQAVVGTTHILAHRQSADSRENDPGPDIWYNVGQWAIENLGLTDGGDFKCGTGSPILPEWRTWGKNKSAETAKEFEQMEEETMNEFELMENPAYENYADEANLYEMEIPDLQKAIRLNRYYSSQLGWDKYMDRVNDFLLPYSGLSNVSLGEEAFARAAYAFQIGNGFTGEHADGIIGPGTWSLISRLLNIPIQSISSPASGNQTIDGVTYRKIRQGWDVASKDSIKDRLMELKQNGKLDISLNEIEMLRLISIPESDQRVNSVNSYDSAFMSMGFLQFTIRYGELQRVIAKAPDAFRKYGIELDSTGIYVVENDRSRAIKNAPDIHELRSIDWAVKFYKAGLDDEVVKAQVYEARNIMDTFLKKDDPRHYLDRYREKEPRLWAFIFEAHNSRPAPLDDALQKTISKATDMNIDDALQFEKLLIEELRQSTAAYYGSPKIQYKTEEDKVKRIKEELEKVGRIITKIGIAG
jgi:phosphatidylserine/phosphatidylglycerophosphate/cardiolipin synthase-like enzyme